ncbi:hypothetical protein CDD83_1188 [Cordyceps sp. RAO-2017]|nr:hypothetical protein CDD83_1188 [Cordyceps sp. RAO-2017]
MHITAATAEPWRRSIPALECRSSSYPPHGFVQTNKPMSPICTPRPSIIHRIEAGPDQSLAPTMGRTRHLVLEQASSAQPEAPARPAARRESPAGRRQDERGHEVPDALPGQRDPQRRTQVITHTSCLQTRTRRALTAASVGRFVRHKLASVFAPSRETVYPFGCTRKDSNQLNDASIQSLRYIFVDTIGW